MEIVCADGGNLEARRNMLRAAVPGGAAFSRSCVGYIHAVAHSLDGQYSIPHGLANSVLMPCVLKTYGPAVWKKCKQLAVAADLAAPQEDERQAAERFIAQIRAMNARMGIPETLSGIRKEDIPQMAAHADKEADPLYPVPVLMDAKALEQFYLKVSEEQ